MPSPVLRKPIMAIESPLDYSELTKVKLQHVDEKGVNRRTEVPISTGSSFESVLYTIREFNVAITTLSLTTGQDLFHAFRLCLDGTAKEEWDIVIKDQEQTLENYEESIKQFKLAFTTSDTKADLIQYLRLVTKPKDMSVHAFVRRVQSINRYIDDIPEHKAGDKELSNLNATDN